MTGAGLGPIVVLGAVEELQDTVAELERGGFDVEGVEATDECLDRLGMTCPAAVVIASGSAADRCMEPLEMIRDRHPDVPVFVSPREGSDGLEDRALAAGASEYVPRTDGPQQLLNRLETRLADDAVLVGDGGRYRQLLESSPAPINLFDAEGTTVWGNDAVLELLGLESRSELVGRSIYEFIHPDDRSIADGELREVVENEIAVGPTFMRLVRSDGDIRHIRVATAPGRFRGEPVGQAVVVDITALRQNERRLERLNELFAECLELETKRAVAEAFVRAAAGPFDLPSFSVAVLDEERGRLRVVAETDASDHAAADATTWTPSGAAWRAFAAGEPMELEHSSGEDGPGGRSLTAVPIGRHGVLVAGIHPDDRDFVGILAETIQAMYDRIEREAALQERDAELSARNETLARLNRINSVIRSVAAELVGATTRRDIDAAVCRRLVDHDGFDFAWIGDFDRTSGRVVPREHVGAETGYLDAIQAVGDEAREESPVDRAGRTRTTQVVDDVVSDPPLEPWRDAALASGFRSTIALPLVYHDGLYGVLAIHAAKPDAFGEMDRAVLDELSHVIAHAMNAIQSRRALISDAVTELELGLALEPGDVQLVDFVRDRPDRAFDLHSVVPSERGGLRVIATFAGTSPGAVASLTRRDRTIDRVEVLTEDDDGCTVELVVSQESPLFWLVEHGAVPRTFTVDGADARLVVELASGTDVRAFLEQLEGVLPSVELLARTDRERPVRTRSELGHGLARRLTDRQLEVLRTAYATGYFESPRNRTGREVARDLGISQPTFSTHLRTALREALALLIEEDGSDQD